MGYRPTLYGASFPRGKTLRVPPSRLVIRTPRPPTRQSTQRGSGRRMAAVDAPRHGLSCSHCGLRLAASMRARVESFVGLIWDGRSLNALNRCSILGPHLWELHSLSLGVINGYKIIFVDSPHELMPVFQEAFRKWILNKAFNRARVWSL